MRRLLDINNPIMRFLVNMFDLMGLSVLWVVFSLPIFTMGAASTALYSAAYHHVRKGEDYLWNSFFSAFKENFKRSTLTWLVALAILGFLGADALLLRSLILRGYPFLWRHAGSAGPGADVDGVSRCLRRPVQRHRERGAAV